MDVRIRRRVTKAAYWMGGRSGQGANGSTSSNAGSAQDLVDENRILRRTRDAPQRVRSASSARRRAVATRLGGRDRCGEQTNGRAVVMVRSKILGAMDDIHALRTFAPTPGTRHAPANRQPKRGFVNFAFIATLAGVSGCSGAQEGVVTDPGISSAGGSTCPGSGASVPLAQLVTQTARFAGCRVSTTASFVAIGAGTFVLPNGYVPTGHTVFRVLPPGQVATTTALGTSESWFATVPDSSATPLFSAPSGTRVRMTGTIEEHTDGSGRDLGNLGRIFRADGIDVVPAASAP